MTTPDDAEASPESLRDLVAAAEQAKADRTGDGGSNGSGKSLSRLIWGGGILVIGLVAFLVRAAVLHHDLAFGQYLWLTLPVAIVGAWIGYKAGIGQGLGLGHISGMVVSLIGTSALTGFTGGAGMSSALFGGMDINCLLNSQASGNQPTDCLSQQTTTASTNPLDSIKHTLTGYWDLYGAVGIISALVTGIVIGVGFTMLVNRNLKNARG